MSTYLHLAIEQEEKAPSRPFRGISELLIEVIVKEQLKETEYKLHDFHEDTKGD